MTARRRTTLDPARFIRDRLPVTFAPGLDTIRLHIATPASGLWRLLEQGGGRDPLPPYWAYCWGGGLALARYFADNPSAVAGKRVLDLGAGSGLVGIAAAQAGACSVSASDTDPLARTALELNAALNDVALTVLADDLTAGPPPEVDLVAAGDVFYSADLAARVIPFLDRCCRAGLTVLVGDPGRAHLPRERLTLLAEYDVPDFGDGPTASGSAAYAYRASPAD